MENVPFNRGFYTVDVKFFYRITADAFCGVGKPTEVSGLCTFDKRVILFGSEGNAKIFSSKTQLGASDDQLMRTANLPTAVVEVVDPICLNVKLVETCSCSPCNCCHDMDLSELPNFICGCFDDDLVLSGDEKRIYATLGQFSIVRLERDTQLIIPCYDFCVPEKECVGSSDDNPCELFSRIKFPVDEFFPPVCGNFEEYRDAKQYCCR